MREQEMETDLEESVAPTEDLTDMGDDASFDPEIKGALAKAAPSPGGQELIEAMDQLKIQTGRSLLRGVPDARGQHLRFTEDGDAVQSPGNRNATILRGIPEPAGKYTKFDI